MTRPRGYVPRSTLPPESPPYDLCRWCRHQWHGLTCDSFGGRCGCEPTPFPRDDSWRPPDSQVSLTSQIMSDHGYDGWTAVYASDVFYAMPSTQRGRIREALLGKRVLL